MANVSRTLRTLLGALVVSALLCGLGRAQTVPEADRAALAGPWRGLWVSDTHEYDALLQLTVTANGAAEGAITWTLRKSNRADYQSKLGLTGTEYVRGRFDARASLLSIDGYRLDDPNKILGTDKYRLVVGDNRRTLGGLTWDHNTWTGRIFLRR
ncbi:MAG: hypothetical protein ACK4UO_10580 [Pseudolabrys sp.]